MVLSLINVDEIENYFDKLFPILRSVTGNGNRETLNIINEIVDLNITEVPSGTQCFDWTVPPEWNLKDAWIKNSKGEKIVDIKNSNLHILGYSTPFTGKLTLKELKEHLYSLPDMPDAIPFLISCYKRRWGFSLTHNQLQSLPEDTYEVLIDSDINSNGSLTYGEAFIKGKSEKEILISTYICHPSLANDNLSGILSAAFLYKELKKRSDLRYSYRFLFIPETIGAIAYLSKHGNELKENLIAGFVLTTCGDRGNFTYKRSRKGNTLPDRAVECVLSSTEKEYTLEDFFPTGSDERQYCSPGFNFPVGSLMRTRYYNFPEYHTSKDNKDFISFEHIKGTIEKYLDVITLIEANDILVRTNPYCEPQLGKYDLYTSLGGQRDTSIINGLIIYILNLADGSNDLIDIVKKSKYDFRLVIEAIRKLVDKNLLKVKD